MRKLIVFSALLLIALPLQSFALTTKYVAVNTVSWDSNGLSNLPTGDSSELTYFVLTTNSRGVLSGGNATQESAFVSSVHNAGKKATFSVGGGNQDSGQMKSAITIANGNKFVNSVASHVSQFGYDGVVLDIENTSTDPQSMADFVNALRVKLDNIKPGLIIGLHVQPYQRTTVWSKMDQAANSITWLAPMLYDRSTFDVTQWISDTNAWLTEVPKEKLLAGLAVNYSASSGGLSTDQYGQMLNAAITQGWAGVSIWNDVLYTQPWIDVARNTIAVQ